MCSTAFLCSVVSLMPRRPSTGAMVACTSEKSCATGISAKSSGVLSVEASVKSFAESPRKRLASSTMAEAKSRRCSSVTTLLMRRMSAKPKMLVSGVFISCAMASAKRLRLSAMPRSFSSRSSMEAVISLMLCASVFNSELPFSGIRTV